MRLLPAILLLGMAGLFSLPLQAQEQEGAGLIAPLSPYRIGLDFQLGRRNESVDLILPGYAPDCGRVLEGSGEGWKVAGLLDYALGETIRLQGSIGLARATGTLRHRGDLFPVRTASNEIVNGRVDQVLSFQSTGLDLSVLATYPFSNKISALFGLGVWMRLHSSELLSEVAIEPADLLLTNNAREFDVSDGVLLTYRPIVPLAVGALRYNLPIGGDSWLSPEVRASWTPFGWTSVDGSWRSLTISLGASLRFGLPGGEHLVLPPPQVDTLEPPVVLFPEIRTAPEVVNVEVTEYDSTEALPLLNRVYFEQGSATIPERYHSLTIPQTTSFSTADLTGPTLDVYYDVLNVIGLRLTRQLDASVTITGYRNSRETDTTLGWRRARAVEEYLLSVWEIAPERIKVQGEGLPPNPAIERGEEGLRENAMVRLEGSTPNLTIPIIRNYIQRVATPPSLTFYPKVIAAAPIAEWTILVETDTEVWKTFSGEGSPPEEIAWDWRSDSSSLPTIPLNLSYLFSVVDSAGNRAQTTRRDVHVTMNTLQEKLINEKQDTVIESYSLLLFAYNSPEVSRQDRALINAIARRVSPGARVRFTGYTDSLGNETANRDLALRRAEAAAKIFSDAVDFDILIDINDDGGERERYTYALPEGRSYDRTVIIEVRTPIGRRDE